jgi:AcrR family transcriptional regulator
MADAAGGMRNPRGEFLRMATLTINQRGYKGASVHRIASGLNVTKGSFYHHNEAKDDLVLACFEHGNERIAAVQFAAATLPRTAGDGLRARWPNWWRCSFPIRRHCCAPRRCRPCRRNGAARC